MFLVSQSSGAVAQRRNQREPSKGGEHHGGLRSRCLGHPGHKSGPACHTGAESCFFEEIFQSEEQNAFSWEGLYALIEGRKTDPKEGSYTTYLFEKGMEKILKKVGEESTEVIIGAAKADKKETIYEVADLAYHVMVMMVQMGIETKDITAELAKRHVIDKKVKQETMA